MSRFSILRSTCVRLNWSMICFCWKTGININWSFHPETSWKWSADGWLIQSCLSTWQSSPLLIAASVTVKGFRYSNANAKHSRLTACQITARQHTSCACVCSILLSGMRFICRRCSNFVSLALKSTCGQICFCPAMNQIRFASTNKQPEPLFHWLARMCTFLIPTKPVQVCWRGPQRFIPPSVT